MSRNASITMPFGDGEQLFRLPIGQLCELQEKTGVSPFVVLTRLLSYLPMVDDVAEIIRLGLIGGGMKPLDALHLVNRYARKSADASVSMEFGDGEHVFHLLIGQLREMEKEKGVSLFAVLARLIAVVPMVEDAPTIIRLGLVGGGMEPEGAVNLVDRYVRQRPLSESIGLATAVLRSALMDTSELIGLATAVLRVALLGAPDEQPGKLPGEAKTPTPPPTSD